jgi:hypothetical protein
MISQMSWTTKAIVKGSCMIHNFLHYGGMALMMQSLIGCMFLPSYYTIMVTIITATMGIVIFLLSIIIGDLFDE